MAMKTTTTPQVVPQNVTEEAALREHLKEVSDEINMMCGHESGKVSGCAATVSVLSVCLVCVCACMDGMGNHYLRMRMPMMTGRRTPPKVSSRVR